jgi:hypothetical protein
VDSNDISSPAVFTGYVDWLCSPVVFTGLNDDITTADWLEKLEASAFGWTASPNYFRQWPKTVAKCA